MRRLLLGVPFVSLWMACYPDFQSTAADGGATSSGGSSSGASGASSSSSGASGGDAASDGASSSGGPVARIPKGTFFFRRGTGGGGAQLTITRDFEIDVRETTVGEFQAWLTAGYPTPDCGGKPTCTLEAGGPHEMHMNWKTSYFDTAHQEAFKSTSCARGAVGATYLKANNAALPMNCVNWTQALAYCAFRGKRLPTEGEWQYVAVGRDQSRTFPWGEDAPDGCTKAIWLNNGLSPDVNGCKFPLPGGSAPAGASRDGVLDMAGSLDEWVWDGDDFTGPNSPAPNDYAGTDGVSRVRKGGGYSTDADYLKGAYRTTTSFDIEYPVLGFRCVKTIP